MNQPHGSGPFDKTFVFNSLGVISLTGHSCNYEEPDPCGQQVCMIPHLSQVLVADI